MGMLARGALILGTLLVSFAVSAASYRIGVLVPLSGAAAEKGIPLKNAAELFVEQFNARKHERDVKLEVVVRDDFDDPEKAKVAAAEMVKDASILGVIGHYYPAAALSAVKVYDEARIPCISPNVSNPSILQASRWMFSVNFPDDVQGAFMAVYIKEVLKRDNVLVVHANDPFGASLKQAFLAKAARIGLSVRQVLSVDASVPPDWAAKQLPGKEANDQVGVVAALTHSEQGLVLLPQLRSQGIKSPVMAPNTWTNPKFLSDLDEKTTADVYVTSALLWEIANQKASQFARAYQKKFGQPPTLAAAMAYDAMMLYGEGLLALDIPGKSMPTRAGLRDHLANLNWLNAVSGASGNLFFGNLTNKRPEYVARFMKEMARESGAESHIATPGGTDGKLPQTASGAHDEHRAVDRDVFVSVMKDGRFKTAAVQLLIPHEEYVLRELADRVRKGYVMVVDGMPYHLVDVVYAGVDIIKINDVNIRDMQWDVDVFMWFKWGGGRLDVKDIEKIGIINAVREQSAILKEDLSHATKYRAYRKRLTLAAPYDLTAFPFDSQTLPMSIAHTNKNSTHVMLVWDSRHMETAPVNDIKPQEWNYVGRNTYSDLYRYESTFGDPDYRLGKGYKSPIYFSTINMDTVVKRIVTPYLFTFFLPLLIILGVILLVLWIPIDQFAPRINAAISGLVGILVYHMSQKNSFPKVGYTIAADYYFLVAYAFIVSMVISIIATQTMVSNGSKDEAKLWNRKVSLGAMLAAVVIYVVLTLVTSYLA